MSNRLMVTGQKRRAPLGSSKYSEEFVVPMMMNCRGLSTGRCAYASRAGPSTCRDNVAFRCSRSALLRPARSDASMIHLPSVASMMRCDVVFSGRSSENQSERGHRARSAVDLFNPCGPSMISSSSYLAQGCRIRLTAATSTIAPTALEYAVSSTPAQAVSHVSRRSTPSHVRPAR